VEITGTDGDNPPGTASYVFITAPVVYIHTAKFNAFDVLR